MNGDERNDQRARRGWAVLLILLWLQLYAACVYGWRFGEYYAYGWYVPPLVGLFFWRIRGLWQGKEVKPLAVPVLVGGGLLLFGLLVGLRTVERVDPRWTLPIWIQAVLVVGVTLLAMQRLGGGRLVLRSIPILAFACSAIPLPTVIERAMISWLTESVIASSSTLLGWLGYSVRTVGDQLSVMGEVVRVTEGCSGIRSAQSFLMASLFFGEWMKLGVVHRLLLLVVGMLTAWCLNVVRASSLAMIRFKGGESELDFWHDSAGLIAFVVGSAILYGVAALMDRGAGGQREVRRRVKGVTG